MDKIESNQSCIAPLCSDMNKKQLFIILQLSQRQNLSKTLTAAEDEMEHCWLGEARLREPPFPGEYNVLFFLLSTIFYFHFFHKQHNIISKIKQNKTADTYSTSQGSIKREGEREGQQEHKSYSFK